MKNSELKKALKEAMGEKILSVHLEKGDDIYNVRDLVIAYGDNIYKTVIITFVNGHIHTINGEINMFHIRAINNLSLEILS